MDNKDLITRFAEDCFRFEALHQEIDSLIADEVSEVLIYEYEDLANQAAEIVLKLSANGNNVGENFYRYYVERLEYIIDYFRALLDYEETPLAEDEQDELDDEPATETHFEGFPAGCVFPSPPPFVFKNWELQFPPMTKDEENAAPLDRKTKQDLEEYKGWVELSKNERKRVLDTLAVYVGLPSAIHEFVCAPKRLQVNDFLHEVKRHFNLLSGFKNFAEPVSIRYHEGVLRGRIWKVINGVENFRDSQMYNALVKLYPTYKEEEDGEYDKPAELDDENDAQAAESDEAAGDTAAGAAISEADISLLPGVDPITESAVRCWERLSSKERAEVRDTFSMWVEMNYTTGRVSGGGDYAEAVKELDYAAWSFSEAKYFLRGGYPKSLVHNEQNLRKMINKAIDAIPGFRESEKFKELIELYPTYKEIEQ